MVNSAAVGESGDGLRRVVACGSIARHARRV
jgi:hypothetical protein